MATPTAAATTVPTQPQPKTTAANIVKGVVARSEGSSSSAAAAKDAQGADPHVEDGDETRKPAADANAGKKKYVVSGREVYLTPEQADAYVQKGLAFEPRISELDRLQRETAAFQRALLDDPGRVIANLAKQRNIPVAQLVERVLGGNGSDDVKEVVGKWYYENAVKLAQMDPRDRALLERDQKISELEKAKKDEAEAAVAADNRAKVSQALAQVSGQIQDTLKELGFQDLNKPGAIRLAKEIADVMRLSFFAKEPCTAKQAAEKVRARIMEYQQHFYDSLDADQLVETLGKENAEKVRKYFLKLVKQQDDGREQKPEKAPVRRSGSRPTITPDEFHDYLDGLKRTSK